MLAVGVDMVTIERVADTLARHGARFLDRVFTAQEQAYCNGRAGSLAGRYAVKEAVAKALGTGIGDIDWVEMEVVCDERGKPELRLHGRAQALAAARGLDLWSISLSHTDSHAVGMAVGMASPADTNG